MSAVLKQQGQYEAFGNAQLDYPVNDHLDWLESEAIHIMREVVAETRNPADTSDSSRRKYVPSSNCAPMR